MKFLLGGLGPPNAEAQKNMYDPSLVQQGSCAAARARYELKNRNLMHTDTSCGFFEKLIGVSNANKMHSEKNNELRRGLACLC